MAGTDATRSPDWSPDGPVTILVAPQMGENIGAAARAMWNFGLRRMRVVNPRDGWPNSRAIANASGAGGVLDEAQLYETTEAAVADLHRVYATTARPRGLTKQVLTPEAAMAEAHGLIAQGARVGFLYGPERSGLENADVVLAQAIVSVPVNPAFASLNLGQCVLLLSAEWRRQIDRTPPEQLHLPGAELALAEDVTRMLEHLEAELDAAGFFHLEHKRPTMVETLRNIFRRAPLTDRDVQTLRGVIRALANGPRRRG